MFGGGTYLITATSEARDSAYFRAFFFEGFFAAGFRADGFRADGFRDVSMSRWLGR